MASAWGAMAGGRTASSARTRWMASSRGILSASPPTDRHRAGTRANCRSSAAAGDAALRSSCDDPPTATQPFFSARPWLDRLKPTMTTAVAQIQPRGPSQSSASLGETWAYRPSGTWIGKVPSCMGFLFCVLGRVVSCLLRNCGGVWKLSLSSSMCPPRGVRNPPPLAQWVEVPWPGQLFGGTASAWLCKHGAFAPRRRQRDHMPLLLPRMTLSMSPASFDMRGYQPRGSPSSPSVLPLLINNEKEPLFRRVVLQLLKRHGSVGAPWTKQETRLAAPPAAVPTSHVGASKCPLCAWLCLFTGSVWRARRARAPTLRNSSLSPRCELRSPYVAVRPECSQLPHRAW